MLQHVEGQVVSILSRHLLGDTSFLSWKWIFSSSWTLCCVFIIHLLNPTWGKKGQRPLHLLIVNINLLGHREDQRVSVSPLLVSAMFLHLPEILEQPSLNISMPGITKRMGGAFLFCLFMFCWGFFWKQAERMSCYLELALCQAAISELHTAWRLNLGESKSCAFTQDEHECCCLALWLPRKKKKE